MQFYYNPLSQPSRSVRLFLKKNGIPVEERIIKIGKGEQHSPEFLKINPRHCVPVLIDGDFVLTEGLAIVLYLLEKFPDKIDDHWYPKDLKKRSRVNEYLSYHDGSTRQQFSRVFQDEFLFKRKGKSTTDDELQEDVENMLYVATQLQDTFLKDQKYLCGDEVTLADLFAVSEVIEPTISGRDCTKDHPQLAAWVARVKERLNPEFDEVYQGFYDVRKEFMANPKFIQEIEY